MNQSEFENWKSQIVISKKERMGLRRKPLVFSEQGVAMLSSVLHSLCVLRPFVLRSFDFPPPLLPYFHLPLSDKIDFAGFITADYTVRFQTGVKDRLFGHVNNSS